MKWILSLLVMSMSFQVLAAEAVTVEEVFNKNPGQYFVDTYEELVDYAAGDGCELKTEFYPHWSENIIVCVFPAMRVTGADVSWMINRVLYVEHNEPYTITGDSRKCEMQWQSSDPQGENNEVGTMSIVSLPENDTLTTFWFGQWHQYEYTKVDYNYGVENEFFLRHEFSVSGEYAGRYKITVDEGGDSHLGMQQIINDAALPVPIEELCEVGW
jgi:hypothetical protein